MIHCNFAVRHRRKRHVDSLETGDMRRDVGHRREACCKVRLCLLDGYDQIALVEELGVVAHSGGDALEGPVYRSLGLFSSSDRIWVYWSSQARLGLSTLFLPHFWRDSLAIKVILERCLTLLHMGLGMLNLYLPIVLPGWTLLQAFL